MKHLAKLFLISVILLCTTSLLFAQNKKQNVTAVEAIDLGDGEFIYKKLDEPVLKPAQWSRPDLSRLSPSAAPGQIYFAEGFEGSWTFGAPPGWTSAPTVNTDSTWHRSEFETGWTAGSSGRPTVRSYYMGGYAARFHSWGAPAGAVGSMMSPNIDLSGATGTCWVSFWWANSGADIINVYTSSDGGSTWTLLGFVGSTGLPWSAAFAPIPTPYTSTMQVRFEGVSDFGANDLNLDEVVVFEEGPAYSGALTLPGTFTDFTDAARKLFIFGVSGPTTISIAPGMYADSATFNVFGSSPVNTVTFMGGGAATVTRVGSLHYGAFGTNVQDAVIDLQGADYTIWDGVNVEGGSACEWGYLLMNQSFDGCFGNVIKNSTIDMNKTVAGTIGIHQVILWIPGPGERAVDNHYLNNIIRDCQNAGIRMNGSFSGGAGDMNNVAEGNLITDINATANAQGFRLGGQSGLMLINNTIDSIGVTGNGTPMGILLGSTTAAGDSVVDFKIYGNVIRRLVGPGMTSNIMSGIRVNSSSAAVYRGQIYNNFISDFSSAGTSTSGAVNAFYLAGRERGVDISYNTVLMDNNVAATGYASIFRVASSGGTFNTQNNIFVNKAVNANSWIHIWNTTSTVNFTSLNNTYYVDTTVSATKHIGRRSTTNYHTLPAWQAVTGQDANTSYEDVDFINATVKPYDLHVDGTTPSTTESGGVPIAGITTDFDGDARNATYPDIGADEYTGTPVDVFGPTILYTPLTAAANTSDRSLNTTISDFNGVAGGVDGPRLYYKKSTDVTWQVDAAPTGVPPSYNFVISAAALGGVSVGDVIQYYVAAQDLNTTPNVSTNPAGGAGVSPPGTTPPATPNSYNVSTTISLLPYLEDFEDPEARDNTSGLGWYSASVAGGVNEWVRDVPAKLSGAWSGTKAYVTNATANYQNNHNGAVYSPVFNFSTAPIDPVLRFYHNFLLEVNFDGGWVEVSTDGGYTWAKQDPVLGTGSDFNTPTSLRWYNNNSTSGVGNPPKFSDTSAAKYASQVDTGYIQSVTTLTGTAGLPDVRVRLRMQSDGSVQRPGWVVDDVEVLILDLVAPSISYTPYDTTASLANRALVVTITDNVAVAGGADGPRLYYKKSTDPSYAFVNATSVVGDQYTFTLDYSLIGGVTGGEIIEYYVAAQDTPQANVSSNPAGATGSNPPGTTPPADPRRYLIELTVSTFPYTEDFEDPPVGKESPMAAGLGWYHKNVRFGASGLDGWVRITPAKPQINAAHSGTKAYVTEAAATYSVNYDAVLISPVFDFSGLVTDPFLEFYHNFKTEGDWDGFIVQYSTDGGATWVKQDPTLGTGGNFNTANSQGWYNDGTYLNEFLPGGAPFFGGGHLGGVGSTGYSTAVNGWVRANSRLAGLAGQSNVRIRFYFSSDQFEVSEGVGIDDVSINLAPANDIGVSSLFGTGLDDRPTSGAEEVPALKLGFENATGASKAGVNYQMDSRRRGDAEKPRKGQRFSALRQVAPPSVMRNNGLIDLSAEVTNSGTGAQATYNVGWAVDGVEQADVPGDPLPGGPGPKDTVTLSLASASDGLHTARAWTELGSDSNPSNDTSNTLWFNVLPPEVVFYEGFNNAQGVPPPGWLFIDADGTNPGWYQSATAYEGDGSAGNNYLASTGLYIDEYLITPNTGGVFDATTVDSLSFQALSVAPPFPDSLMIMVSTTGTDTSNFTPLAYLDISSGATFVKYTFALPNAANRYIAFRYLHYDGGPFGNGSNAIRLDDVRITRYTLEVTIGVPVLQSWNMVSLPVSSPVPDDSVSHIFTNSDFPYGFAFNNGYVQRYVMENGPGYWIKSSTAYTQDITGTQRDTLTVPVAMNWNMIGSITTSIDTSVAHVTPSVPGLRVSNFFKYNNGYVVATTIDPGLGYWVKASVNGSFFMHATTAPGKPSGELAKAQRTVEELNTLTIRDANGGSQTLYFGADANSDIPVSMYAMPPMPPEGSFDARFTSSEGGTMVQTHASEIVEMPIAIQSGAYPLTVSWKVTDGSYELSDGAGGSHPLRGEGTLRVTEESSLVLKVTGGSELPKEFALHQNYPNPFNPTTTIKYALPVDSRITVEMYNIVGQRVKTLIDGEQTAGYHVAEWNGTNDAGKQVASGMYFLRMSAEGKNGKKFTDVRKLMLLK